MKKILVSMFLLVFGLCLVGCDIINNPKKPSIEMLYSDWYNCAKLPSMQDPFAEVYDGCYSIKIAENNNVTFKSINQEQLNGILEYEEKEYTIDIKITFENNEIANGNLSISNDSPYLHFFYKGVNHCFTKSRVISKEEFDLYCSEFNAFLRDSFNNNTYPSLEEVETDELYRQYTNFHQIDPCCNGPKQYISVNKVVIDINTEKDEFIVTYSDGKIENINIFDVENIVLVKLDGTFKKLDNIQDGQCFITENHTLFYFECEHQWDEGVVDPSSSLSNPPIKYTCLLCGVTKKEPTEWLEHSHDYIDGLCDCGKFDNTWIIENFRLSDEQILFEGNVDDEFNCDVILLTLKHTTTYIELSKKHFKLDVVTDVVYLSSTPPSHFYEPGNEDKLNNFHQIVFLYVDVETKEEIIELIKELEKLPFIRSAEPNYIEHPC